VLTIRQNSESLGAKKSAAHINVAETEQPVARAAQEREKK